MSENNIFDFHVILMIIDKIDISRINDQGFHITPAFHVNKIAVLKLSKIFRTDSLLIIATAFPDIFDELFHRKVKVDIEIGNGKMLVDDIVELAVEVVFVFRQGDAGEYQGFGEVIVGDGKRREHVTVGELFFVLPVAFGQEGQFKRERIFFRDRCRILAGMDSLQISQE